MTRFLQILLLLPFFAACQDEFKKSPFNDYEKELRRVPIEDRKRMLITKDWEKMDSMTFLRLVNVEQIFLQKTDTIPEWLFKYKKLKSIWGGRSKSIRSIPVSFEKIGELRFVNLPNEMLSEIPTSFFNSPNLKSVFLDSNNITTIPTIKNPSLQIETLNLNNNNIETISPSICSLGKLMFLHLEFNRIEYLPDCIGQCKLLKKLYLNNNRLIEIPDALYDLPELKYIDLRGNPLKNPAEIKRRFAEKAIRCYVDE